MGHPRPPSRRHKRHVNSQRGAAFHNQHEFAKGEPCTRSAASIPTIDARQWTATTECDVQNHSSPARQCKHRPGLRNHIRQTFHLEERKMDSEVVHIGQTNYAPSARPRATPTPRTNRVPCEEETPKVTSHIATAPFLHQEATPKDAILQLLLPLFPRNPWRSRLDVLYYHVYSATLTTWMHRSSTTPQHYWP